MKNKYFISVFMCVWGLLGIILTNSIFLKIHAEESIENIDKVQFKTIEKQILNSEKWCSSTDDELKITLDIENMWFLTGEDIIVSYLVSEEQEITNFNYNTTGFEVVDIEIDEQNSSGIIVELDCLPNEEDYFLNLSITIGESQTNVYLYAINNEYGTFVSPYSKSNAYERFLEYLLSENIIAFEQAQNMWYDFLESSLENTLDVADITMSNIDSLVSPTSVGKGTICGYLEWAETNHENSNDIHPLRGVKVEVYYEYEGIGFWLATTYTNDDGYFFVEIDPHDNVYIQIYAGDDNIMVCSGILGFPYCIKYAPQYNVTNGTTVVVDPAPFEMNNEAKQAFQIAQAAIAARDYADAMMDQDITPVTIIYPASSDITTCYIPVLSCIAIVGDQDASVYKPYETWDVIMHEYGHHIELLLNIILEPWDQHYSDKNHSDEYGTEAGTRFAWGESWNTVFALMAQNYMIANGKLDSNIDTVGDARYTQKNNNFFDIELYGVAKGEACEQSIMSVLWDLYDSNNEGKDEITLTHEEYWNLTTEWGTYRFSDMVNRFYEIYANDPEMIAKFAKNLTDYQMAPTLPYILNSSSISINNPPELFWNSQGGSELYPNNSFDIIVYDMEYNEIIRIEMLSITCYIFDTTDWKQALENHGYMCNGIFEAYITVSGSRREALPLDQNFSTGPYYSEYAYISFEMPHDFELYDYCYEKCTKCGHTVQVKPHDYFYNYSAFDETTHYAYCECGDYVSIAHNYEPYDSCYEKCVDCGQKKQIADHDFTYRYSSNDANTHYAYCECGLSIMAQHSFTISGMLEKCTYCNLEKNHVHSYTYTSCKDGRTHRRSCRCGVSTYEQCFGIATSGEFTKCSKCGQFLTGGITPFFRKEENASDE